MPAIDTHGTGAIYLSNVWNERKTYRMDVIVSEDEHGIHSAIVANLLGGIGSCGKTEQGAIEGAREALRGALLEYEASGVEIPWEDASVLDLPAGSRREAVTLNA